MPDPATDMQPTNPTPVAAPAPPMEDTTPPNIPTTAPVPATTPSVIPQNTPSLPTPPKQTFAQGFEQGGTPLYSTDAAGNIIRVAPPVRRSVGGVLGGILRGALEGATRGIAAQTPPGSMGRGAAVSAGARAAIEGKVAADERARKIAQQNFENQQAVTAAKVRQNMEVAQTALITQNMNFAAEEHPGIMRSRELENETAELGLQGTRQKLLEDGVDFKENMAKLGIDPTSFTEHSPALNAQIPGLVSGSVRAVHNGQAEGSNGVDVYPRSTLDAPITKPVTYNTYDGAVDKEGVPVPTQHVLQPDGKITANNYLDRYFAGQAQLTRQAQQISARMTMEQHKAAVKESNAKAFEATAAGEANLAAAGLSAGGGAAVGDRTKTGDDYIKTLPAGNQDVVRGLTHYEMKPSDLGRAKDRKVIIGEAIHASNGTWSEPEYNERYKFLTNWRDLKSGAGATIYRLNTAVGHLDSLGTAAAALSQNNVQALNQIANAWGVQTGATPVITYQAIANKAAGEMAGAIKGGSGSATDQEIDKAIESYNPKLSPAQQMASIKSALMLLNTVKNSLDFTFQSTMKQTPEQFGQPVLAPQNSIVMQKWMNPTFTHQPPRPANVPSDYTFNPNGPKGAGWYRPAGNQ